MYTEIIIKETLETVNFFQKNIGIQNPQHRVPFDLCQLWWSFNVTSHSGKLIFDGHRRNLGKVREPEEVDSPPEGVGVGAGEEIEFRISGNRDSLKNDHGTGQKGKVVRNAEREGEEDLVQLETERNIIIIILFTRVRNLVIRTDINKLNIK